MIEINYKEFKSIQNVFPFIPFTQSDNWYNYLISKGEKIIFYCNNLNEPSYACLCKVKKIPIFGNILRIEGELVNKNVSNEKITDFYKKLTHLRYLGIEINSNNEYSIDYEIGVRRAGFLRPIGFNSCPLSIIINLTEPLRFNKNWRKNYNRSKEKELSLIEVNHPDLEIMSTFSEIYTEMSATKKMGYTLNPKNLLALVDGNKMRLFLVKTKGNVVLSCRIVYVNETYSSDVYAANSNLARGSGASFFLLQSILEKLASEGIKTFDVSQIPPSNGPSDGIYLFKRAISGEKIQYNGEWAYYPKQLVEYLMHFGKSFYGRIQRY